MSTRQHGVSPDTLQDHSVVDYLRDHPEFFNTHTGLLAEIQVPHQSHGAISLIERQVTVLRDQNQDIKRQLQALVHVARDNDRLNQRVQRLTLALLAAKDLNATLRVIANSLHEDFRADALVLCLLGKTPRLPERDETGQLRLRRLLPDDLDGSFATLLATGKPLCGHLRRSQLNALFEDEAADPAAQIGSAVVLALKSPGEVPARLGLLGIGSRDNKRYHAGMGTLFLSFLGELIGHALARHLP